MNKRLEGNVAIITGTELNVGGGRMAELNTGSARWEEKA